MSHTSQRRGLSRSRPGEEIVLLAMIPAGQRDRREARLAMVELADKVFKHRPHSWISRNFPALDIKRIGKLQPGLRFLHFLSPQASREVLFRGLAGRSPVITAVFTDLDAVASLLAELNDGWLERNRRRNLGISIVLSGLFGDIRKCCSRTGLREHTYLHSLGTFGMTGRLPPGPALELLTMCGHGMISANRIEALTRALGQGSITPKQAADDIARPCVCGIVNRHRAEKVFRRLAGQSDRS